MSNLVRERNPHYCQTRSADRGDSGVSAVIGAVLVFGLMSSAFIIWSFTTLPVWISDNEEARNIDVEQSFNTLTAGASQLFAANSSGPVIASFPLGADEVPLLQPAPSNGQLYYESGFNWAIEFTTVPSCSGAACDHTASGGGVVFSPINLHYLEQDIIWEGGAVLREQPDGAAVANAPGFDLNLSSGIATLDWTVIDAAGSGHISGGQSANAVLTYLGSVNRSVSMPSGTATVTIDSLHCSAWQSFLAAEVQLNGLASNAAVSSCDSNGRITVDLSTGGAVTWQIDYRVLDTSVVVGS